ncbi:hypothetical protein PGT21_028452 [Puccinia graminis f. sp. tritici]|uniref:Uncharacterized protein n=1 Tax=Puccinia graminis f. sp. tritici TaxID=56615 RepID=A0A5B0MLY8_PUCGR|nr:hypothetical protein PGT21_028452 [Puccinia graminis f. sp. tritici]
MRRKNRWDRSKNRMSAGVGARFGEIHGSMSGRSISPSKHDDLTAFDTPFVVQNEPRYTGVIPT